MSSQNALSDYQPTWKLERHPALRHPLRIDRCDASVLVSDCNVLDFHQVAAQSVHQLFEDYCDSLGFRRAANKIAVDYETEQYSFSALDGLANQIARYLIDEGVQAGDRIGLFFDRSIYAYASILGFMKAGAAFVPLDKSFPADRIEFILGDSDASLLLTVSAIAGTLPNITKLPL